VKTLTLLVALTLGGTMTLAQSVTYDIDRSADFSRFRSYTWVAGTTLDDALNHRRIVSAIDTQLSARKLVKIDGGAADLLVAYHTTFDRNLQITGFASGWGPYRFGGGRIGSAVAEEILVGTLVVDIVDAKTKTIVWRGRATGEIDVNARPDRRERNINRVAEKLFKNYPAAK
jgi:hypothetical protein